MKFVGGTGKVQLFSNRQEATEVSKLHRVTAQSQFVFGMQMSWNTLLASELMKVTPPVLSLLC